MKVEESVFIKGTKEKVWETFTDLTCWRDWNTIMKDVSTGRTDRLVEGKKFKCCIREIKEVVQYELIVWSTSKYGIYARHEFIFSEKDAGVQVISREVFKSLNNTAMVFIFPEKKVKELTLQFLKDLKEAVESS
jgi:hypothetical protein